MSEPNDKAVENLADTVEMLIDEIKSLTGKLAVAESNRDSARDNFFTMQRTAAKHLNRAKKAEEAIADYIAARDTYEGATKPNGAFGRSKSLAPSDPIAIRYREARAALDSL